MTGFPPDVQQFVVHEVAAGNYRNEEELLIDAVRRMRDSQARFLQFREELQEEIARMDQGEETVIEGDEALAAFFEELKKEARAELAAERSEKQ